MIAGRPKEWSAYRLSVRNVVKRGPRSWTLLAPVQVCEEGCMMGEWEKPSKRDGVSVSEDATATLGLPSINAQLQRKLQRQNLGQHALDVVITSSLDLTGFL